MILRENRPWHLLNTRPSFENGCQITQFFEENSLSVCENRSKGKRGQNYCVFCFYRLRELVKEPVSSIIYSLCQYCQRLEPKGLRKCPISYCLNPYLPMILLRWSSLNIYRFLIFKLFSTILIIRKKRGVPQDRRSRNLIRSYRHKKRHA